MYSVVLAAMLTASPTVAPAFGHGWHGCCGGYSSCCCGGWYSSCCCGGWYSSCCCGGYYSCCGGYNCNCSGYYNCNCGGYNCNCSGYSNCNCGGYNCNCSGYYNCNCGGYNCNCSGYSNCNCSGYSNCNCSGYSNCNCSGYSNCNCSGYNCNCSGYSNCNCSGYSNCNCGGYNCNCSGYSCCCGGSYSSCCCGGYSYSGGYGNYSYAVTAPAYAAPQAAPTYSASEAGPGLLDRLIDRLEKRLGPVYAAPEGTPVSATPQVAPSGPPPMVTPSLPAPVVAPSPPAPPPQAASSFQATVVVKAPLDAGIVVNGQSVGHTKAEQVFTTPDLTPGKSYVYDFRAEVVRDGKTVTRNQKVTVQAGRQSQADFSELSRDDAPARVTIKAPADARVLVGDFEVPPTSRTFQTPTLENGRTYYYTVKAEMVRNGKGVSESKRVTLLAGKEVSVEFNEPSVATAGR